MIIRKTRVVSIYIAEVKLVNFPGLKYLQVRSCRSTVVTRGSKTTILYVGESPNSVLAVRYAALARACSAGACGVA